MKRWFSILVISVFVFFVPLFPVQAQTRRDVSDFAYQYEQYRQLYSTYTLKRDTFLKQQTLSSQNDAVEYTHKILIQRALVMKSYLLALKRLVSENPGVASDTKVRLRESLDNEIGWLQNHMDTLAEMRNPTLSLLFEQAKLSEGKSEGFRNLAYEVRATNILGKMRYLYQNYIAVSTNMLPFVDQATDKAGYLRNWYTEVQDNGSLASKAINRAQDAINALNDSSRQSTGIDQVYNKVFDETENTQRILLKGVSFQKEIINKLKENLPKDIIKTIKDEPAIIQGNSTPIVATEGAVIK